MTEEELRKYEEQQWLKSPDARRAQLRQQYLPRFDEATNGFLYGEEAFQRRQQERAQRNEDLPKDNG